MKKVFSMFLILIMILPLLPANASEGSCLIEFNTAQPITINGKLTRAYISEYYDGDAELETKSGTTGWCLTPGSAYNTIYINLNDSYMNRLDGNRDVLMDVCYYDGDTGDAGSKFCVYYVSQKHLYENAGIITLTGSGEWKTHTFVLEKPKLSDIGAAPYYRNISISVTSTYMGTSEGEVIIASADIYYGDERELFFTLDSENVGNIFFNTDPVILDMIFENPFAVSHGDLTASITLVNQLTGEEYDTDKVISLGSAKSHTEQLDLTELDLPFGLYDVSADIYDGDTLVISDVTELSRINARGNIEPSLEGVNNSFLGFNTHAGNYTADTIKDLMYLAKKSGVGFVRITISWESIEKTAGEYIIPNYIMTILTEAKKNNLKVMALLGNNRTGLYPNYKPWRTGSTGDNFQGYLDKYSDYVQYVVTQLKDYVECWEIYNEYGMDYPGNFKVEAVAKDAARDYADILKTGYEAVKDADPDAVVVGGVLDGNTSEIAFTDTLYGTYDAADYMDVLSFHSYCSGSDTSGEIRTLNTKTDRFNGYIDTYGDNEELYLDEFNFTLPGGLSEEEQALYNVRLLTKLKYEAELDRIYPYCLESTSYNLSSGYGFIDRPEDDHDYIVKPAAARPNYASFAFMNKLLRLSDAMDFTEDANGNYIYEFYDNIHERPVYVIWNKTESSTKSSSVTIEDEGTELTAYDMYGNAISTGDGSVTVTTGRKPVYVAGPERDLTFIQDDETYKVTMSGEGTAGESISIAVLNKGTEEADFSSISNVHYIDQKLIASDGIWQFTFKITQGNGAYTILVTDESGRMVTYNLNYDTGNLTVAYEFTQEQGRVESFDSLADGNLDINYRIDNPENKNTSFLVFGCLYKGDELVKVAKSPDGQLMETDLIKTGSITIPDVKKSEIDKLQMMVFDGTDNVRPLVKKFVLE